MWEITSYITFFLGMEGLCERRISSIVSVGLSIVLLTPPLFVSKSIYVWCFDFGMHYQNYKTHNDRMNKIIVSA